MATRPILVPTLVLLIAGSSPALATEAALTYEALAEAATPTRDVATLLGALVDKCDAEKRDIERARCRATRSYLHRTLPERTFLMGADDPAAIAVSDYDARLRGYHITLAGCVACTNPIAVGRAGDRRFVTLKTPQKDAETLPRAVEIAGGTLGFENVVEAKRWLETVRPLLRAELMFRPVATDWTFGPGRGYALALVGGRIYDHCTGEVLVSMPPSAAMVPQHAGGPDEACNSPGSEHGTGTADAPSDDNLPDQLSTAAIADAMGKIRPQVFACFEKHQVPGNAVLTYVVAGNGTVQSIRMSGAFDGTPTGACVLDAGKNAHFSRFRAGRQEFSYPFFLRP